MDKKLILYLVILAGLDHRHRDFLNISSKKTLDGSTLTNDEIELLEDSGQFDYDSEEGKCSSPSTTKTPNFLPKNSAMAKSLPLNWPPPIKSF